MNYALGLNFILCRYYFLFSKILNYFPRFFSSPLPHHCFPVISCVSSFLSLPMSSVRLSPLCLYPHFYSLVLSLFLPISMSLSLSFFVTPLPFISLLLPCDLLVILLPYFVLSPVILVIPFSICLSSHLFRSPALLSYLPRLSFNLLHPIFIYSILLISH